MVIRHANTINQVIPFFIDKKTCILKLFFYTLTVLLSVSCFPTCISSIHVSWHQPSASPGVIPLQWSCWFWGWIQKKMELLQVCLINLWHACDGVTHGFSSPSIHNTMSLIAHSTRQPHTPVSKHLTSSSDNLALCHLLKRSNFFSSILLLSQLWWTFPYDFNIYIEQVLSLLLL